MIETFKYISKHPVTKNAPLQACLRFFAWQIASRTRPGTHEIRWINNTKLLVRNGMHGATGNIYCGLHEFAEMAFVLHFLSETDLFCDIGANVGTYTVLASGARNAETIAFEPDLEALADLQNNIAANGIGQRVTTEPVALSAENTVFSFTLGQGTINHVASSDDKLVRDVQARRLDDVLNGRCPALMKIDVEGHEAEVLRGAEKTLADPRLLAITIETFDAEVESITAKHGFTPTFYDPMSRRLTDEAPGYQLHNTLLIRDRATAEQRLKNAQPFTVFNRTY